MNRTVRRLLALALLLCFALPLTGCGKTESGDVPPETPAETVPTPELPAGDPVETVPEETGNVNPLTGLRDGISDEALQTRPVAIMVSNIITSLPQWGVSDADILFEMLAEGRITRLMAIFQDPSRIDHIASIRSARPYFIDMAQSYGAVYIHFGGSVPAYEAIAARGDLLEIDGINGGWKGALFDRDPDRKAALGSEHAVYTTGERLAEGLPKLDKDLTQEGHPSAFTFGEHSSAEQGEAGGKVQITFSDRHKPYFEYDEASGEYLRYEYDAKQMDGWSNRQISVKNVLLLRMDTADVKGNSLGLIEIQTTGSGEGYYFCGGKYIPVTWKKDSYNGELRIYDAAGAEVVFSPGKSFVSCILRTGKVDIW